MNAPRVLVDYIGPGVWIRITGTDRAGEQVTVSGPVVAGPDEIDGAIVVKVRDDHARCDRVIRTVPGTIVDLIDETGDRPVFERVAVRVHLVRRRIGRTGKRLSTDRWFPETHENVSAEQLAGWEQWNPDVRLTAVHHEHISAWDASR